MAKVTLVSCDGVEFCGVSVDTVAGSLAIREMLDCLGINEQVEEKIPLLNVTGEVLKIVLDWATNHEGVFTFK